MADYRKKHTRLWERFDEASHGNAEQMKDIAEAALDALEQAEQQIPELNTQPFGFTDGDKHGMVYEPRHADRLKEPVALYRATQTAPARFVKMPGNIATCPECGSESLTWAPAVTIHNTVQQGRLTTKDVSGLFYLGCDECSETVAHASAEEIATFLNDCRTASKK